MSEIANLHRTNMQHLLSIIGINLKKENLSLKYYDIKNSLAHKYHNKYFGDWLTDNRKIKLWNQKKEYIATIDYNKLVFTTENDDEFKTWRSFSDEITSDYVNQLEIDYFQRVGLKVFSVIESDENYENLVNRLSKIFYPKNEILTSIVGDRYADIALVFDFNKSNFYNNVQIGPVRSDEIKDKLKEYSQFINEKTLPSTGILIDIDISIENLKVSDYSKTINNALNIYSENIEKLEQFLSS